MKSSLLTEKWQLKQSHFIPTRMAKRKTDITKYRQGCGARRREEETLSKSNNFSSMFSPAKYIDMQGGEWDEKIHGKCFGT